MAVPYAISGELYGLSFACVRALRGEPSDEDHRSCARCGRYMGTVRTWFCEPCVRRIGHERAAKYATKRDKELRDLRARTVAHAS